MQIGENSNQWCTHKMSEGAAIVSSQSCDVTNQF